MKALTIITAAIMVGLWLPGLTLAQDATANTECIRLYNKYRQQYNWPALTPTQESGDVCKLLSVAIYDHLKAKWTFTNVAEPRDFQAYKEGSATSSGTPAQETSVSTVEVVEQGGGSIALTGTKAGAGSILSLAINPSIFIANQNDQETVSKFGRFTDFSVLVPATQVDVDSNGVVDYFGFRLRVNVNGLEQGGEVYKNVKAAYDAILNAGTVELERIRDLIRGTGKDDCVEALLSGDLSKIKTQCGGDLVIHDPSLEQALQNKIESARIQADRGYYGIDIRGDFGDLNLGGIDTVSGTSLYGGVAYGFRNIDQDGQGSLGGRLRLGAYYFNPTKRDSGVTRDGRIALDGGIGFEVNKYYAYQRLTLSSGLEFRWDATKSEVTDSSKASTSTPLNYGIIRTSLSVPVFEGTSISLNIGMPLWGNLGTSLSINANWRLLWSNSRERK